MELLVQQHNVHQQRQVQHRIHLQVLIHGLHLQALEVSAQYQYPAAVVVEKETLVFAKEAKADQEVIYDIGIMLLFLRVVVIQLSLVVEVLQVVVPILQVVALVIL